MVLQPDDDGSDCTREYPQFVEGNILQPMAREGVGCIVCLVPASDFEGNASLRDGELEPYADSRLLCYLRVRFPLLAPWVSSLLAYVRVHVNSRPVVQSTRWPQAATVANFICKPSICIAAAPTSFPVQCIRGSVFDTGSMQSSFQPEHHALRCAGIEAAAQASCLLRHANDMYAEQGGLL